METILEKSSSKVIWSSMKHKYKGSKMTLRIDFEVLQLKEGEGVNAFFARTFTIPNKMKMHGETLTQVESNDLDKVTIDELQGSLLVHE
ncbi:hypothetical protein LXL04_032974 [Taraxacum kok-saghyz]